MHGIKHNIGKKCVAAKGACKLSSWLRPQSGYKWVRRSYSTYKKLSYGVLAKLIISTWRHMR